MAYDHDVVLGKSGEFGHWLDQFSVDKRLRSWGTKLKGAVMQKQFDRAFFFLLDGARVDIFEELLHKGDLPNVARTVRAPGSLPPGDHRLSVGDRGGLHPVSDRPVPRPRQHPRLSLVRSRALSATAAVGDALPQLPRPRQLPHGPRPVEVGDARCSSSSSRRRTSSRGISRGTGIRRNAAYFRRVPATLKFFRTGDWDHIDARRRGVPAARGHAQAREVHVSHHLLDRRVLAPPRAVLRARARALPRVRQACSAGCAETLRRTGQLETSLLVMGADHGHTEVKSHFDLEGFIERLGYKTLYLPQADEALARRQRRRHGRGQRRRATST